ncbi:MAG: fibrobacter succinogenes major paralogous domain-containing protein [Bacteroidales bacterium]
MERLTSTSTFTILVMTVLILFAGSCKKTDPVAVPTTITDIDGNVYHTISIGSQVWMVENLRVTKYNDGTAIPQVTDSAAWGNLKTPGYCWYNNNESIYKNIYGALYNGYVLNTDKKIAPSGWHIPSDTEWMILTTYLGGENVAGNKLKETGSQHWSIMNTNATNESGFTAFPGGYRSSSFAKFVGMGTVGNWWSSTPYGYGFIYRFMDDDEGKVGSNNTNKEFGYSIRCIRD